jgi:repressor LexA
MLTPRQRAAYDFVLRFSERKGYAPSYDEIRRHLGLASLNAVAKLIAQLRRRGYLVEAPRNAKRWLAASPDRADPDRRGPLAGGVRQGRSPESVRRRPEPATLPLLGTIAAGRPIEAIETPEEIEVPSSLLGRASAGERYALRVRGDSMIEDGIHDGDVIVVRRARRAENGQTVVAIIDGEATLKRFHAERAAVRGGSPWIELRPANAALKPIRVPAERVEIRGVLVGLLRKYK